MKSDRTHGTLVHTFAASGAQFNIHGDLTLFAHRQGANRTDKTRSFLAAQTGDRHVNTDFLQLGDADARERGRDRTEMSVAASHLAHPAAHASANIAVNHFETISGRCHLDVQPSVTGEVNENSGSARNTRLPTHHPGVLSTPQCWNIFDTQEFFNLHGIGDVHLRQSDRPWQEGADHTAMRNEDRASRH